MNGALVIRDIIKNDQGNYICAATSAGVFNVETGTNVEIKGRLILVTLFHFDIQLKIKGSDFLMEGGIIQCR